MDFVEFGSTDEGIGLTGCYVEVADGAVAYVRASSWEAGFVVAVAFQVSTPGMTPERFGNFCSAKGGDGLGGVALLTQFGYGLFRLGLALGYGNVGRLFVVVHFGWVIEN